MPLDAHSSRLAHSAQNLALISLSLALLPLSSFILFLSMAYNFLRTSPQEKLRYRIRSPISPLFQPRTILVTGVGMSKGLALARLFHTAGHDVVGADFEPPLLPITSGRTSKALRAFYRLRKPHGRGSAREYASSIIDIVNREKVDIWVSCSGVASALEDGLAKEMVELLTSCRAVQFDAATTKRLHEKHSFIQHVRSLGLPTPETHTITSKAAALELLKRDSEKGRTYIMKYIGTDDLLRGDMTLLPLATPAATDAHLSRLQISEDRPWILQQFIRGPEYCTHSLVVEGKVKAFVACPSAELLMHYEALPPESSLSQSMLRFTQEVAAAAGSSFTGHLSFDFLVESDEAEAALRDPTRDVSIYPIECNPRAHTAVVLFNQTPALAEAYVSVLDQKRAQSPYKSGAALTNGDAGRPIYPEQPARYFWVGHDLVAECVVPYLGLLDPRGPSFASVFDSITGFAENSFSWRDGTFEVWDPWPAWWLYHVYWPAQFAMALVGGKKWSRVNVSTCKMFEC